MSKTISPGDTIAVHYTGRVKDGEVFDSTRERMPVKFTVGMGNLIGGFEKAVLGMQAGEKKTVAIEPADAYGEATTDLIIDLPRENVPEGETLIKGATIVLGDAHGNTRPGVITMVEETFVRVDLNHCLAGKTLVFDIEILEVD